MDGREENSPPRDRLEIFLLDEALAFLDGQNLIHARARDFINRAARPADFYQVNLGALLKAEVQPQVALRDVAAAAPNLVRLREIAGDDFNTRADAVAIAPHADGLNQDGVVRVAAVVAQQLRRAVEVADDYVNVAVVVYVAEGDATAHALLRERGAELFADLGECAIAVVVVHELALAVVYELRIDVAVGDEQINPAVVVVVEELRPPAD